MRKNLKFLGIITLVVVIVFSITACDDGGGDSGSVADGTAHYDESLVISGEQVYTVTYNESNGANIYTALNDTFDVTLAPDYYSGSSIGTGTVTAGKLTFTVNEPTSSQTSNWDFVEYQFDEWDSPAVTPTDVKFFYLFIFENPTAGYGYNPIRLRYKNRTSSMDVNWVYVDKDCTISGGQKNKNWAGYIFTNQAFSINLKKGWNALCTTSTYNQSSGTEKLEIKYPKNVKWVYDNDW
jgi:hypothetical protein